MTARLARLACSFVALGGAARAADPPAPKPDDPIIIIGERNSAAPGAIRADTQLDENAIAAYGADTVGDLLGALATGPDPSGEGPYILINGVPASGIDDIADLPAEAASKIQLLSRNAASLLGQRPTRRVINVVIKPNHRQLTLNAKGGLATAGGGRQGEGEVNLLRLDQGNRRSLVLRVTDRDRLLESDRDIVTAPILDLYDPLGIATDLGRYRTLLPYALGLSANGNVTQRFGPSLLSLTLRGEHQESDARIGPAIAGFNLPGTSPFSPAGGDVGVVQIIGDPLAQKSRSTALTGAAVLNGPLGTWRYSVNANLTRRSSLSRSQQGYDLAALQAGIDLGSINPFIALDPMLLGARRIDRSSGVATNGGVQATLAGSPFKLPAGAARLSLRVEDRFNRARSKFGSGTSDVARRLHRNEALAAGSLQLPLIASKALGSIGLELSGAVHHVTASGWLNDLGIALNWDPTSRLSLRAAINREQIAPPSTALTDPLIRVDNVRTYDFIRQETVFVTFLTGGNPGLGIERRRATSLGATWQPIDSADFSINADYRSIRGRDAFAALPPVNADVQAAFPDRFQRDLSGRLIAVDARPVPFDLVRRDELHWGATFSRNFGVSMPVNPPSGSNDESAAMVAGWRTNVFFQHSWTLASKRRARDGLPTIDLLDGGAIGYGGGVPRHQLQFGGGVVHRGIGLQVDGDITGKSTVATGTLATPDTLRFAARALVNARLFINLGPQLPNQAWAKGARISFGVENLFDSKARVRDGSGNTPIGYQPYLIDPLGRVVTLALRKVF